MLIEVTEPSQAGEARRKATALAEHLQMSASQCGQVALVTTEMATNLVKHAGRGHILVQAVAQDGHDGMRVTSVDKGPGIADVAKALTDGPLASGSLGTGLGTIRRVPDNFDLYSVPGSGTVVTAEFWRAHPRPHTASPLQVGVVSEPIKGEEECGDGWAIKSFSDGALLMVVDGLGHGVLAAEAAREAERIFNASHDESIKNLMTDIHDALRKTRGAAASIARINVDKGLVTFAGIGNVAASVVSRSGSRGLAGHNGTLGQQIARFQEFTHPWASDSILIVHSDGLSSRWDIERYPGIWSRPPSVIAALLHRDFSRGRDDVTVMVAKPASVN
jgi:anti-sigma regulatory factor (Ser/Thr protein kinase)